MTWPFGDIAPLSADIILADPAWLFELRSVKGELKSPQAHYRCMTIDEICALPVSQLCRGDAVCIMWTTWPMLVSGKLTEAAPAIRAMCSWGFRPVTGGAWFKRTTHDKAAFGTGYRLRSACEPFILGVLGNPETSKAVRNTIETFEEMHSIIAKTREHSRKPDEIYDLCERLFPSAVSGVELFARQIYRGGRIQWQQALSDEADKFDMDAGNQATV